MSDEDFAVLTALFVATLLLMSPVPRAVAATFWASSPGIASDATMVDEAMPAAFSGGRLPMPM